MKKAMTVTYKVDNGLYVNITNKCSNNCMFCIRNNGDGAYGSDSLWLTREPTVDEICESIFANYSEDIAELVFCGYGEPTYRLDAMTSVVRRVKDRYPDLPIRVNTNGQSDLINGRSTAKDFCMFDTVSISLNTPDAEKYETLCIPKYGKDAFFAMLSFAKEVKKYSPNVLLSVVRETLSEDELRRCKEIADECGVTLKVRTYISA